MEITDKATIGNLKKHAKAYTKRIAGELLDNRFTSGNIKPELHEFLLDMLVTDTYKASCLINQTIEENNYNQVKIGGAILSF